MAKRAARSPAAVDERPKRTAEDKIAGALAFLVVKDLDTQKAVLRLDAIGFEAQEISALLDVTPNYIAVVRYQKKSADKKKRKKAR